MKITDEMVCAAADVYVEESEENFVSHGWMRKALEAALGKAEYEYGVRLNDGTFLEIGENDIPHAEPRTVVRRLKAGEWEDVR